MTANAMAGDREKCLESGMDDYISKPIRLEEVQEVIQRWGLSVQRYRKKSYTGSSEGLIDTEKIESLIRVGRGDDAFVQELIRLYTEQAPYFIEQMKAMAHNNELKRVEEFAHTLKGTSANIGARKMHMVCEHAEKYANRGDKVKLVQCLSDLDQIYPKTIDEMIHFVQGELKK